MSVIEVHPEELLDRELRGTLSVSESVLLNAHLERCAACRLERHLRADFDRELAVPAYASDDLTDVIAGALRACEQPTQASAAPSFAAATGHSSLGAKVAPLDRLLGRAATPPAVRRVAMLLVACTVLSVGIGYAGAQLGLAERGFGALLEQVGLGPARHVSTRRLPAASASAPKLAVAPVQPLVASPRDADEPRLAASAERPSRGARPVAPSLRQRSVERRPAATAHAPKRAQAASSLVTPTPRTPAPPVPALVQDVVSASAAPAAPDNSSSYVIPAPPVETSGRLFERANRARHRGAVGDAEVLYGELRARFPESPEARLSLAVVARMQLDHGELRAALSGFEAYLGTSDRALHEEAMVGRIRALTRLDRERDATAAAAALLKAHPRSAFAPEAEALIERAERD